MKIRTKKKPLSGYLCFSRAMIYLFQNKKMGLDFDTLGLYIAVASECDWDRRHLNYGYLNKPDDYLAWRWGCNLSTVWRKKSKLKELGLLVATESGYLKLKYFELFDNALAKKLAKQDFANVQEFIAEAQEKIADMQPVIAKLQENYGQNDPQSFNVSSKGNIGFSESESGEMSEEERAWRGEQEKESSNGVSMAEVAEEVFGNWKP